VCEYLAKNKIKVIPHPLYSPDLVPCILFHFPKLKRALKERKVINITMIQAKSWDALHKML
jgi:hypothetical protein